MKHIESSLSSLPATHLTTGIGESDEKLVAAIERGGTLGTAALYAELAISLMCSTPHLVNSTYAPVSLFEAVKV